MVSDASGMECASVETEKQDALLGATRLEEVQRKGGGYWKLCALLLLVAVIITAAKTGLVSMDIHRLRDGMAARGLANGWGFLALASVLIFFGAPRLIFFALAGLLLGFGKGFALAMAASLLGSYLSFLCFRWLGREWVQQKYGHRSSISRITGIQPGVLSVFMVRQLPVGNVFLNAGLALSRVGSISFIMGSLLGFIPQGVVAGLIGSGASSDHATHAGALQLGIATLLLLFIPLWRWYTRRRSSHVSAGVAESDCVEPDPHA